MVFTPCMVLDMSVCITTKKYAMQTAVQTNFSTLAHITVTANCLKQIFIYQIYHQMHTEICNKYTKKPAKINKSCLTQKNMPTIFFLFSPEHILLLASKNHLIL